MKLYYFTASYPFGLGELWKSNELEVLVRHFDQIIVIPYSYDGNFENPKILPAGVELWGPLFEDSAFTVNKWTGLGKVFLNRYRRIFLKELFAKKVLLNKARFMSWLYASLNVIRLMNNPIIQRVIKNLDEKSVLYFFWGKGASEILPFIDTSRCFKTFVRMHRYDLFETESNNYIPFRRSLIKSADVVAPSSEAGRLHLKELYPDLNYKIKLFRLGTIGNGKQSRASEDNIFRIVSCSYLSKVKRVDLMVESLQYLDFPVLWRHLGDGKERKKIESLIQKYRLEGKFIIEGIIDSRKILDFYTSNTIDLFVNVSDSEGVPFSIMESLSVSIPVMATKVGGTGELVDDKVGKILSPGLSSKELAKAITDYYYLPKKEKEQKKHTAFIRSKEQCDAIQLTNELAVALKSSCS